MYIFKFVFCTSHPGMFVLLFFGATKNKSTPSTTLTAFQIFKEHYCASPDFSLHIKYRQILWEKV